MSIDRSTVSLVLIGAAVLGLVAGFGFSATTSQAPPQIATSPHSLLADSGIVRQRKPQSGDVWGGCNDARAAGSAPIYAGEPGYRSDMDGDGDGIACEPVS